MSEPFFLPKELDSQIYQNFSLIWAEATILILQFWYLGWHEVHSITNTDEKYKAWNFMCSVHKYWLCLIT